MLTREQIAIRPVRLGAEDYAGIAALYGAYFAAHDVDRRYSAADIESFLTAPDFFPDLTQVVEEDGRIVAYSEHVPSAATGNAWGDLIVHPDYRGRGIGSALLAHADARLLERAKTYIPAHLPVIARRGATAVDAAAFRLMEREGYTYARSFYEMRIALGSSPASALPEGFHLEPFDRQKHDRALYEVHEEAFSQHWGFERDPWEEWEHYVYERPNTDPTLWLIAFDDQGIAGYSINRQMRDDDPTFAWIAALGVLPRARRRGLGEALLRGSFALFQERGCTRAGLAVDAENTTNALALYERVGMHVHRTTHSYQKMLRAAE
ncbi:MAG: GNAT family N-acetyltransferase [Anaerolineae bacterium]|nr:GNAT family N-acetyltransferase [Anaerolineae bacterium]NUQ05165.1 GNAT family N-acetyltransferase [Anaerolineae bacterium]